MFYNTGIATYIWVLTNRKPSHRKGRAQLIDATRWFKPLRKDLGKKHCELSAEDIQRMVPDEQRIELAGFIYEAHTEYEVIRVRQANLTYADGTSSKQNRWAIPSCKKRIVIGL